MKNTTLFTLLFVFTFVQITDVQIGMREKNVPGYPQTLQPLQKCIDQINGLKPEFVINTGDLVDISYDNDQCKCYKECMSNLHAPMYVIPGNHDMRPYNDSTYNVWMNAHGTDRFSFIHKHCAFIGIDSNCLMEHDVKRSDEQYRWLEQELKKAQKCRFIFLFAHCPVFKERIDEEKDHFNYYQEDREKYLELCKKYKVDAFFSGHTHVGYRAKIGNTEFINCCATGVAIKGGVPGYNVIKVGPKGWSCTFVKL